MKVGDLVKYQEKYWHPRRAVVQAGVVLAVNNNYPEEACPIRVRWTNHTDSERDWYAEEELTRINLTQRSK